MGRKISGIPAASGLAIGTVAWLKKAARTDDLPTHITASRVEAETKRLQSAAEVAREQITQLREATAEQIGEAEAAVFDAHLAFLSDPSYFDEIVARVGRDLVSPEAACAAVTTEVSDMLAALPDEYLSARADDIRDVGDRLLGLLSNQGASPSTAFAAGSVVVADELTPSQTAQLTNEVVALVTRRGSKTGHAAIIARTLGIPMVVGAGEVLDGLEDGATVVIDGDAGTVDIGPTEAELRSVRERQQAQAIKREQAMAAVHGQAVTQDGKRIEVFANIGSPKDVETALTNGAEGVGLFRTEFLYQENDHWPTEDEQFVAYVQVLTAFDGAPVIIRTLDIGGDKPLPYAELPKEDNPFLGERAIRFCLAHPEIFRTQLRALLRASVKGNLHVMVPMVENVDEVEAVKALLYECRGELLAEGVDTAEIKLGIMVEIPAAAMMADVLAQHVDFMSIGTNDLTQYTLAVDRGNERIANLYDAAHPAVLRLIGKTCSAAAQAGIPVGVCGELAGDPAMAETLVGLGVTELSMSAMRIAEVKARVRQVRSNSARALADEVQQLPSTAAVLARVKGR